MGENETEGDKDARIESLLRDTGRSFRERLAVTAEHETALKQRSIAAAIARFEERSRKITLRKRLNLTFSLKPVRVAVPAMALAVALALLLSNVLQKQTEQEPMQIAATVSDLTNLDEEIVLAYHEFEEEYQSQTIEDANVDSLFSDYENLIVSDVTFDILNEDLLTTEEYYDENDIEAES